MNYPQYLNQKLTLSFVFCMLIVCCSLAPLYGQFTNGQNADQVIGQPDLTSNTANNGGVSASSLNTLVHNAAVDLANNKIYVADRGNNRVLRYVYPFVGNQPAAEAVFGQPDFTSNTGGVSASIMRGPSKVTVDADGRLWVVDAINNRILRFDNAAGKANGAAADGVLGQPDFTSSTDNNGGISASTMNIPFSVCPGAGGRIWVSDYENNRILRFDNAAGKANGAAADGVLGQPDFTSRTANNGEISASSMHHPASSFEDASGRIWVADASNNRVLRFDNAAGKANGAAADGVLGQPNFTSAMYNNGGISASSMHLPVGTFVDGISNLYVIDGSNTRVLIFQNAAAKTNGGAADFVLGQSDFTSITTGSTANKFNLDLGNAGDNIFVDVCNNKLWIGDSANSRILGFTASSSLGNNASCSAATVAQAPIPTMSQWGLLIFGLVIMNLSIFFVQRRVLI